MYLVTILSISVLPILLIQYSKLKAEAEIKIHETTLSKFIKRPGNPLWLVSLMPFHHYFLLTFVV